MIEVIMELNELYVSTLLAASDYVQHDYNRQSSINRFNKEVASVIKVVFYDFHDLKMYLEDKIEILEHGDRWYNFDGKLQIELKALYLSLDVCNSFITRFIDGGTNSTYLVKHD